MGNSISAYINKIFQNTHNDLVLANNKLTVMNKDYMNRILILEEDIKNMNSDNFRNDYAELDTICNQLENTNLMLCNKVKDLEEKIIQLDKSGQDETNILSKKQFEKKLHDSVDKMVDELLKNSEINNSIIPDFIERKIYTNIFTILINVLKDVMEDTNISLLNQNITFKMTPNDE